MDLDDQFRRYFGTSDLAALTPAAIAAGTERMRVESGLEKDRDRRFALFAGATRERGAAAVTVTHCAATAAIADRVLTLTAAEPVEQRGG